MNSLDSPSLTGLLLSDDLIFTSRITGVARDLGFSMKVARSPAELQQWLDQLAPRCIIVDLHNPGLDINQLVESLKEGDQPMPFLVGYGSHVHTATLKAARQAGCHLVLPRSQFVEDLPTALPGWFAGELSAG